MYIKQITIQGARGLAPAPGNGDVEIIRTDDGALVTNGDAILCEVRRDEDRKRRYWKAHEVARVIFGQVRDRRTGKLVPNATNSMIHDVLTEIERVAGC